MKIPHYLNALLALLCLTSISLSVYLLYPKVGCKFTYVNSDIACDEAPAISKTGYVALQNDLEKFIQEQSLGSVKEVSVYFRDLRAGPTFSVNGDAHFAPASLLKLPLIVTLMSLEEENPGSLKTKIIFRKESLAQFDIPPQIEPPLVTLTEGQTYTLDTLMRNTIVYSDNNSYYTLVAFLNNVVEGGEAMILRTFQELGVIDPRSIDEEVVTVQGYASIFRILYNASYLLPESSEKVLVWLAETTYTKGLRAGVPAGVGVAHKFGERVLPNGSKQLHDCGIVMYPKNPYTLCIMTRGTDWEALRSTIKQISEMVFKEVDSRANKMK